MDDIRSYVIRTTRMSDHQKEAYQRLQSVYCIPIAEDESAETALRWDQVFPHRREEPGRPVILDIGFGMGYELAELADRWRDHDFLGIEVHKPGVGKLLGELEKRALENVRVMRSDAVRICRSFIPPGTVRGIHIFFPDPWPKKRHHKRRLIRPGFPELIAPLLQRDGYVYLVTDWEDYARQMVRVLDESPHLDNRYPDDEGFAPSLTWRPETAFERKGLGKGHRIFELVYERAPGASVTDTPDA